MEALNENYCLLRPKILEHHFSSSSDWKSYIKVKETSQFPYMFLKLK